MASFRLPGPLGRDTASDFFWIDAGTLCLHLSPPPGKVPSAAHQKKVKQQQRKHKRKHAAPALQPVPTTREGFLNAIRDFEGEVPHMYLDTKGYATVGIGFLIEDTGTGQMTEDAKKWTFVVRGTSQHATREQIEADFAAVKKRPWGEKIGAATFKPYTKLELEKNKIKELFNQKVDEFWAQLQAEFGAQFNTFPMAVQYALLDMIFNLGRGTEYKQGKKTVRTGLHAFRKLRAALEHRDWKAAGDAAHRRGPRESRNDANKSWFYSADSPLIPVT